MYEIMSADEAIRLIRDGDCICVNSFVGIENPTELHEALYRRYQKMQSPTHLTIVSSAGFGAWDDEHNAEGYIREGAVDKLICGHFGAMMSTKKLVLEDRFEAYNLPLGCISHAIRAQAGGLPGALSKVGLDIFVDPRREGPGINRISIDDSLVKHVEVDGDEFLYYKLPKITIAMIKGTAADRKGNITFDDVGENTNHLTRFYLAATKHFIIQQWGTLGIHASVIQFNGLDFDNEHGVAVGVNYRFNRPLDGFWSKALNGLNLMGEYYDGVFNVGGNYAIWKDRINLTASLYDGRYWSVGLFFKVCLK